MPKVGSERKGRSIIVAICQPVVLHATLGGLKHYFISTANGSSWAHCLTIGTPIANRCLYNCDKKVTAQYQSARPTNADT
jgi:hypothetical protein